MKLFNVCDCHRIWGFFITKLKTRLRCKDYSDVYTDDAVDTIYDNVRGTVSYYLEVSCPLRKLGKTVKQLECLGVKNKVLSWVTLNLNNRGQRKTLNLYFNSGQ